MKNTLPASGFVLLAGFAFFSSGCVAQYESTASVTAYSGTTLPATSTVALAMEFRGGTPTPQERADVRAILADYFAQQGTVVVDDTDVADYLVHAVMERRNPENPAEWTVVETYSANSLRSAGSDEFRWPGGMIEDDTYEPTAFSYSGYGVFYPVFFDLWSSPWHRGRVILYPSVRRHNNWSNDRWRDERRWHRPDRWQPARHPEWTRRDQPDRRREDNARRDENRRDGQRSDRDRRDGNRQDNDRRDNDRRDDNNRRPNTERGRPPSADTPRHDTTPQPIVRPDAGHQPPQVRPPQGDDRRRDQARPPQGGDRRPDQFRPPQPERPRHITPVNPPPVAPQPDTPPPEARTEHPRRGPSYTPGQGPGLNRPQQSQTPTNPPEPSHVQPADRRAGSPNQVQPGNPERRQPPSRVVRETPPAQPAQPPPPQVRTERRDAPPPESHARNPREEQRRRAVEPQPAPQPARTDRRPPPTDEDKSKDQDKDDDSDRGRRRR